jgi:hypothetical protein
MNKKIKLTFAPGCFDSFEGTQEELDDLISTITDFFEGKTSEELQGQVVPLEEFFEDLDDEEFSDFEKVFNNNPDKRSLN